MLEAAGYTDKAQRQHNEDAYFLNDDIGLYIVADGVGGLEAGEVASNLICDTVNQRIVSGSSLEHAIAAAHVEIAASVSRGEGKQGMASTIVVARFTGGDYELAWVGDSRIYLWDGQLKLLTKDHSYVQALYDAGQITLEETDTHPKKNVITQAVGGAAETISISSNRGTLGGGESLLLCSDGVSGEVTGAQLIEHMSGSSAPEEVAKNLVGCAIDAGGKDNATGVYVRAMSEAGDAEEATARVIKPDVYRTYNQSESRYVAVPTGVAEAPEVLGANASQVADSTSIIRAAPKKEAVDTKVDVEQELGKRPLLLIFCVGVAVAALIAYGLRGL
ncbi:MAG: PP2C family serine/threonine-protein phosphatase [Pseudomonadales bacterium]